MTLQACNSSSSYRLAQHLYYPDLGKHQLPGGVRGEGEGERRGEEGRGREDKSTVSNATFLINI